MTNQEAIDIIKTAIAQVEWDYPMDYAAAFDVAIKALDQEKYGNIALFTPDTPHCEIEKTLKDVAVQQLIESDVLQFSIDPEPKPIQLDDGKVEFYVTGAWKITAPRPTKEEP